MIRHSFKLIWNQKKKNAFTILELFLLFIVIFVGSSILLEKIIKYTEGVGGETDNVFYLYILGDEEVDGLHMKPMFQLKEKFKELDWIEEVSITNDASPYIWSYQGESLRNNEQRVQVSTGLADHNFDDVLQVPLIEGEWFDAEDTSLNPIPIIIDKKAAQELFGDSSAIGKVASYYHFKVKIWGIISHFKNSNYEDIEPTMFFPIARHWNWQGYPKTEFLIKVKQNVQPNPKQLKSVVYSILDPTHYKIIKAAFLDSMKKTSNAYDNSQMLMIILIASFLVFNFFLGLIGILGYNINKRKSEIGLRRAVGSTRGKIQSLLLMEIYAITLLAMIPALIIVVQIPLLNLIVIPTSLFLKALGVTIFVIFTLITLTVYYPSVLASRIEPAVALNEE